MTHHEDHEEKENKFRVLHALRDENISLTLLGIIPQPTFYNLRSDLIKYLGNKERYLLC